MFARNASRRIASQRDSNIGPYAGPNAAKHCTKKKTTTTTIAYKGEGHKNQFNSHLIFRHDFLWVRDIESPWEYLKKKNYHDGKKIVKFHQLLDNDWTFVFYILYLAPETKFPIFLPVYLEYLVNENFERVVQLTNVTDDVRRSSIDFRRLSSLGPKIRFCKNLKRR